MTNPKPDGRFLKLGILVALLAGAFILFRFTPLKTYTEKDALLVLLENLRGAWWGPIVFVLIYGIGCVFALPGSLLTLAGGALFGTGLGTLYNIAASNLGASLAFFMARFLGRDFVAGLMRGGKLADFDGKVARNGFSVIFRLRLIPLVPFNGLNFGAGFSKIRYRDYLLGSMLGMLPATFIYTYFADSLLAGATGAGRQAMINLLIAAALLIAISFLPKLLPSKQKKS